MKQTLFPLSLLVALLFVGIGCDRRPFKDDPAFDDKVLILENNPELLLVRMTKDSLADRPITDEASATDFLVRTLARSIPSMEQCPTGNGWNSALPSSVPPARHSNSSRRSTCSPTSTGATTTCGASWTSSSVP